MYFDFRLITRIHASKQGFKMTTQKMNYQKELEKILTEIDEKQKTTVSYNKPTLLLHACCGPCSSYVI